MKNTALIFLLVMMLGLCAGVGYVFVLANRQAIPEPEPVLEESSTPEPAETTPEPSATLPDRITLDVPFYVQAPFAVWDEIHNETCEEAAFLMVRDYYTKQHLTKEQIENELQEFVAWQTDHGYKYDITLQQLSQAAAAFYQFDNGEVMINPTIKQIKSLVAAGQPVILPAAGRLLPNPNFTPPGPLYHMVVIKGYDPEGFITNDPGTRNGEDFYYKYDDLMDAIHDWDPTNILSGQRAVMFYDR